MGKTGYIYPQWMGAKRKLMEALGRSQSWDDTCNIVETWFRNHAFEVGTSVSIDNHYLLDKNVDRDRLMEHEKQRAVRGLAEEMLKTEMYIRETQHADEFRQTFSYSVLLFGCPLATGPGTRERAGSSGPVAGTE